MTKIFNDAEDKNVATNVVYLNESNALFHDAACTDAVEAEECLNLFHKGVIGIKAGTHYAAVSCTSEGVIDFGM